MEGTILIVSVLLNVLLIVSTGILIWDKFKPEKVNLKCELIRDPTKGYIYHLIITNTTTLQLKLKRILLDDSDIDSIDRREFPLILQPQNEIDFRITCTKDSPKPTNCKIEVLKTRKSKTLEYSI